MQSLPAKGRQGNLRLGGKQGGLRLEPWPIYGIADDRMSDRGKMNSDLVGSPRLQRAR